MEKRIEALKELLQVKEELEAKIASLQDSIKAEMEEMNTDEIKGEGFTVTWKEVVSHRIDTKALKAKCPKIAERYTVESTYRRFILK